MKKFTRITFVFVVMTMLFSLISCSALNGGMPLGPSGGGSSGGDYGDMPPMAPSGPSGSEGGDKGGFGDDVMADTPSTEGGFEEMPDIIPPDADSGDEPEVPDTDENVRLPAGMITAGAHNDNQYYSDWQRLFEQGENENGKFFIYTNPSYSWGFNSLNRVKVSVTNGENAVSGASVVATDSQGNTLFSAVSDANGNAYLFTAMESGNITVTSGDGSAAASFDADNRDISVNLDSCGEKRNIIEIMLVVDVTGSMGDEIDFLKAELADVINRIAENNSGAAIKLAMLFYRDTDDRVPFDYYDFTDVTTSAGMLAQQTALNLQYATGGGDYPEAVDEALDLAVNKQWSSGATTKIIFHVLDAPAHEGSKYATKLVNATKTAAEKGIRICPIICSGAAESTEYTMREAAIYTGGTFIFVTDDSGIGGSHHDPSLPNTTIELLNSLMVRLVNGYHTGDFEDPIYWKQDPNLNNK